jgi:hypothetical protein
MLFYKLFFWAFIAYATIVVAYTYGVQAGRNKQSKVDASYYSTMFNQLRNNIQEQMDRMLNFLSDLGYKKKAVELSKCCNAPVEIGGIGDFKDTDAPTTQYYVCCKCKKPCDIKKVKY